VTNQADSLKKYEIITTPDPHYTQSNAWFLDCERRQAPFVLIQKKTKYYELRWDFISMTAHGYRFEPDAGLCDRILVIMHRYWPLKKRIWIWGPVCEIPKLTLEQAKAAAVEIYDELAAVPLVSHEAAGRLL